jgi:hypothetical protein
MPGWAMLCRHSTAPGNEHHAPEPEALLKVVEHFGVRLGIAPIAINDVVCDRPAIDHDKADQHLGAEGIVSKKVDRTYRSGLSRAWIKVRNPTSIAVAGSGPRPRQRLYARSMQQTRKGIVSFSAARLEIKSVLLIAPLREPYALRFLPNVN